MIDMSEMIERSEKIQSDIQAIQLRFAMSSFQGSAASSAVSVTLTGNGILQQVYIDQNLLILGNAALVSDLLVEAHADARRRMETTMAEEMEKLTSGWIVDPQP